MSEELIKRLLETGKVSLGTETTIKAIKKGLARGVLLSSNCPEQRAKEIMDLAKKSNVRVYMYPGTSLELGEACGKPFPVSAMAIFDYGDADLSTLEVSE